jgi:hypothetical protein
MCWSGGLRRSGRSSQASRASGDEGEVRGSELNDSHHRFNRQRL